MRVFTEFELREQYRNNPFSTFYLPGCCRLTPAAAQFLSEKKVKVVKDESTSSPSSCTGKEGETSPKGFAETGYLLPDGRVCQEKPEHMTHLRGRELVDKRHPRILLRGQLDSLQAQIIDTIIEFETMGYGQVAGQLDEMLKLSRAVLRSEVTGESLPEPRFDGFDSTTIRDMSHHPDKYLRVKHFVPSPVHGRLMAKLNILRTLVREVELAAAEAFCLDNYEVERKDIMEALNRMSSMVYIMMCRLLAGKYSIGRSKE